MCVCVCVCARMCAWMALIISTSTGSLLLLSLLVTVDSYVYKLIKIAFISMQRLLVSKCMQMHTTYTYWH